MQKAIIVTGDSSSSLNELNDLLDKGWRVVSSCPMPSSISARDEIFHPTCLVILEE